MSTPRAYRSPVRDTAAAATRERILGAAEMILAADGVGGLAFQRVAAQAEVSVPTVYRHFRTPEDLLGAFFLWFRPRVGLAHDALFRTSLDEFSQLPARNFSAFEAHGAVLRALIDSPEANRVRERAITDRPGRAAANFHAHAPRWPPKELGLRIGALAIMQSPQTWRWLRDTWGLDAHEAQRVATWAIQSMAAALREGPVTPRVAPRRPQKNSTAKPTLTPRARSKGKKR